MVSITRAMSRHGIGACLGAKSGPASPGRSDRAGSGHGRDCAGRRRRWSWRGHRGHAVMRGSGHGVVMAWSWRGQGARRIRIGPLAVDGSTTRPCWVISTSPAATSRRAARRRRLHQLSPASGIDGAGGVRGADRGARGPAGQQVSDRGFELPVDGVDSATAAGVAAIGDVSPSSVPTSSARRSSGRSCGRSCSEHPRPQVIGSGRVDRRPGGSGTTEFVVQLGEQRAGLGQRSPTSIGRLAQRACSPAYSPISTG